MAERVLALSEFRWYKCPRCDRTCIAEPMSRKTTVRLVDADGHVHHCGEGQ